MTFRYIFGKPGSGKTALCAAEIIKAQSNSSKAALIYVVPEQFSLSAERLLLEASGNAGLVEAQVLSFNRLAYSVFRETGRNGLLPLDNVGKNLLIRRALTELSNGLESKLKFYRSKNTLKSRGFVEKLSSLITEFQNYGILPTDLARASVNERSGLSAAGKLRLNDLGAIYGRYLGYIEDGFISSDSQLDILAMKIPESGFLSGCHVWIDGFKSFTAQEYSVITALAGVCESFSVAMTLDADVCKEAQNFNGVFLDLSSFDPFDEVKSTVNKLTNVIETWLGGDCAQGNNIFLNNTPRYDNFPALRFLIDHHFNPSDKPYNGNTDGLFITPYPDAEAETEAAAREIVKLTRLGFRYNEIGLAVSAPSIYNGCLKRIFKRYGIPLFLDENRSLLFHPLAELCRGILAGAVSGMTYGNVFMVLKTGLTGIPNDDIDILENFVLRYGISGRGWEKEWTFGYDGDEEGAKKINVLRQNVLSLFLKTKSKLPASEFCETFYSFIVESGVKSRLSDWIRLEEDKEKAEEHRQMWARFILILERISETLGEEPVSAAELSLLMEAGFESESLRLAPPTLDHITAGDISRSRLTEVRALFILGMNEGLMPSPADPQGILPDLDRELLREQGISLASSMAGKAMEERLNIYQILGKPTERLYLSYFNGGGENPCDILTDIQAMVPKVNNTPREPVTLAEPMLGELFTAVNGNLLTEALMDVYGILTKDERFSYKLRLAEEAKLRDDKADESLYTLSQSDITGLYGDSPARLKTSVTRLESYAGCPFMYFGRYNLNLRDRKLYQIENFDVGNILHLILERYTKIIMSGNPDDNRDETISRIINETAAESVNAILLSSRRYMAVKDRMETIARNTIDALDWQLSMGDFNIIDAEMAFEGANAYKVPLDGPPVKQYVELTGRVDRADGLINNGKEYIRIIDYKSGTRTFSFSDVYRGLQLQLAAYLAAYLQSHPESEPAAALYFIVANHIADYRKGLDRESLRDELLGSYRMSGAVTSDIDMIKRMDGGITSRSKIIPVQLISQGTETSKTSPVLDETGFKALIMAAENKIKETALRILSGSVPPFPLYHKGGLACEHCSSRALCRRDDRAGANDDRRQFSPLSDREALKRILEEYNV